MLELIVTISAIIFVFLATIFIIVGKRNKRKELEEKENKISQPKKTIISEPKEKTLGLRKHPKHNNRKTTRGRKVQYVELDGKTKPIYH